MQTLRRAGLIAAFFTGACASPREIAPQAAPPELPSQSEVQFILHLLHANAEEVADTLVEMLDASRRASITRNVGYCALMTPEFWAKQKNGSQPRNIETQIVADPKTNSIVISALSDEVDDINRMRELIWRLDAYVDGVQHAELEHAN